MMIKTLEMVFIHKQIVHTTSMPFTNLSIWEKSSKFYLKIMIYFKWVFKVKIHDWFSFLTANMTIFLPGDM